VFFSTKSKFFCLSVVLFSWLFILNPVGAASKAKQADLYEELDLFAKALHFVRENYVVSPDDQELLYGAIQGMLQSLDPHSVFLPPEIYKELQLDTTGRFGGVGIEVTIRDGLLTVITPIEGTPASRAGLRSGDRILRINGKSTRHMTLGDAVKLMRGKRGSKVNLRLARNGRGQPFNVALRREIIRIKSVRGVEELGDGLAYIRISAFQEDTAKSLERALRDLEKKPDGLHGLILDMRNNPGGLLTEAIEVSDKFLGKGTIVSTKSRGAPKQKRIARQDGTHPDFPIIILVNGGSASAAEIVAGALQDNKRATVLGTTTFGKGSVQTVFEMGDGAALKLTVARYFTPSGRSIQDHGIKPDIIVKAIIKEEVIELEESKGEAKESFSIEVEEDTQKQAAIELLRKRLGLKATG